MSAPSPETNKKSKPHSPSFKLRIASDSSSNGSGVRSAAQRRKKTKMREQKQKKENSKLSRLLTKYVILGTIAILSSFVCVVLYMGWRKWRFWWLWMLLLTLFGMSFFASPFSHVWWVCKSAMSTLSVDRVGPPVLTPKSNHKWMNYSHAGKCFHNWFYSASTSHCGVRATVDEIPRKIDLSFVFFTQRLGGAMNSWNMFF